MTSDKSDFQLKADVEAELFWDPKLNSARIAVSVDHGAVSLLGTVDTFAEKFAAEDAVRRVGGVRAIAQDLAVKLLPHHLRGDGEIAAAVERALQWDVFVPREVTAVVRDGVITLGGVVHWNFQREEAARTVRHLPGVVAIQNDIVLRPETSASTLREQIRTALYRQANTDAESIQIETSGHGKVTLSGHASSWQAIDDASRAAWAARGVTDVVAEVKLTPAH